MLKTTIGFTVIATALVALSGCNTARPLEDSSQHSLKQSFQGRLTQIDWRGYSMFGTKDLFPKQVYNDGIFTYLIYDEEHPLPVVYIEESGQTMVVNTRIIGNAYIVEAVVPVLVLKSANDVARITYEPDHG